MDSILSQSRPADEIIIVDGGSVDRTVEIINSYIENGAPIKLIVKQGINISEGRNCAIKNAKYDYIASADAGCVLDRNWLKNIIKPFEENSEVDIAFGFIMPEVSTTYEECVAELTYPKLELIDPNTFSPASNLIAFKKECWKKVGGYPEWLYTAEDTIFNLNLKKAGYKFGFVKDAVVYWRPRRNLKGLFKQYYLYSKGVAQANITSIMLKPYGKNIVFYTVYLLRHTLSKKKTVYLYYMPVILITIFISKIMGIIAGKIGKFDMGGRLNLF